ncbi:hypothetical protein [Pseudomonas sp. MWU12-2323]|uniref:hypothetical protein n=1 Tax=Pseudomonas sp. MWU12-2323 TaxID=2651296 RepID=UPI00128B5B46|nr:hypothetical protein [Pseudomonas sp. MWU12-2323]MPQ69248.1 hypothetical protein [Pseudomonas sp. MWU12-2323]
MTKTARLTLIIAGFVIAICLASAAVISASSQKIDKWAGLDEFKASLQAKLASSAGNADQFNIASLAGKLAAFRIDGMAVCAPDEISAEQYIQLAAINEKLTANYKGVAAQLNDLLAKDTGITDCQFRVLDTATTPPTRIK